MSLSTLTVNDDADNNNNNMKIYNAHIVKQ